MSTVALGWAAVGCAEVAMLFDIPLDRITEDHLQSLVTDCVPEDRQLEYKSALPGKKDRADVIEFLKDVSALANCVGGDIVYGVQEGRDDSGNTVAVSLEGIAGEDSDRVKLRLEDIIRNCIKVRLIGVRIQALSLASGNTIFIVRVPASWNAPHVVDYDKHWRFYYRGAAASYPMDVTELRNAVTSANTLRQRLEEFRFGRLAAIAADPTLHRHGKIVLHFQPFDSVREDFEVDLSRASLKRSNLILMRFEETESATRRNFDGLLVSAANKSKPETNLRLGYIQIFRGGAIEEVDAGTLPMTDPKRKGEHYIPSRKFEGYTIRAVRRRLALLKDLDIKSPVLVHLSLLGVKGYRMEVEGRVDYWDDYPERSAIDRDDLLIRGVLMDDFHAVDDDKLFQYAAAKLRRSFDAVWGAADYKGSLHYDPDGNWTGSIH